MPISLYIIGQLSVTPSRFLLKAGAKENKTTALEAGTLNVPGIAGLGAGVHWLLTQGVETLEAKENALARLFCETVREIPGVQLYGDFTAPRAPIVSLNLMGEDSARVADALWEEYGICVRAGAHCAPLMHKAPICLCAPSQQDARRGSRSSVPSYRGSDEGK